MRTSLLTGRFLNQLVNEGRYRHHAPGRSSKEGRLLWWGHDHQMVFVEGNRLWTAWVAGPVDDIDEFEFAYCGVLDGTNGEHHGNS